METKQRPHTQGEYRLCDGGEIWAFHTGSLKEYICTVEQAGVVGGRTENARKVSSALTLLDAGADMLAALEQVQTQGPYLCVASEDGSEVHRLKEILDVVDAVLSKARGVTP